MMKNSLKVLCTLVALISLVLPASATFVPNQQQSLLKPIPSDFDPLQDKIIVTVTITEIRALKTIDLLTNPDFYVKVTINDEEIVSGVWQNTKYVENPDWSASCEVPKDVEFVNVTLALWDKSALSDRLCDISPDGEGNYSQQRTAEMTYSIAAGIWWGDDRLGDLSGYGRLSGIDDNTIYQQDRDCELWFVITQNDFDGDNLPYWLETDVYETDPVVDNRGEDADQDGIPIEWEHTFGLAYNEWGHDEGYYMVCDPFSWENYTSADEDEDGLDNVEEYKTWQWGSDPYRQDIFIEIDQMEKGPNGEGSVVQVEAYDLLRDSYARHNIVWHIDDGRLGGGEFIPFKETVDDNDPEQWYWNYFMHKDLNNWRRGIFRWCIVSYNYTWAEGFVFGSRIDGQWALDAFFISTSFHDMRSKLFLLLGGLRSGTFSRVMSRAYVYAGAIMHETGHTLNIQAPGCDARETVWPWQENFWRYANYKSCMNYRYVYRGIVDYSDGTHGKNDYDDWGTIDLTLINPRPHW